MIPAPLTHAHFSLHKQVIDLVLVHNIDASDEGVAMADSLGRAAVPRLIGDGECLVFGVAKEALAANEAPQFRACAAQLLVTLGITLAVSSHVSILAEALRDAHRRRPAGRRAAVLVVAGVDRQRLALHDAIWAARLAVRAAAVAA